MIKTSIRELFGAYYYANNRNNFCNMDDWIKFYGGVINPNDDIVSFSEDDWLVFKLIYREYF